jgi:hypothetical protein
MAPQDFLIEYLPILIFMIIALGISGAMVLGSLLVAKQKPDAEKNSAYECGFDAFGCAEQVRCAVLSRDAALHHFRSRNCVPVSMGYLALRG